MGAPRQALLKPPVIHGVLEGGQDTQLQKLLGGPANVARYVCPL